MSPGTADTLLLAGGGLLASEATGLTDVTPVGRSSGEGPNRPRIPTPGTPPTALPPSLNLGELFSNFATPADVAAAFQAGADAGGQGVSSDALIQAFQSGANAAQGGQRVPTTEEIIDLIDERTPDPPDVPDVPDVPGPGPGPGPTSGDDGSSSPDFHLQDLEGTGPMNIGTWAAAGGEIGARTGDVASDTMDFLERGAAGWNMLLTGETTDPETGNRIQRPTLDLGDGDEPGSNDGFRADLFVPGLAAAREWGDVPDVDAPDLGGLSPIGTASADTDPADSGTSSSETSGGRDSSYTPSSREVPTRPARPGPTAGSSSSSSTSSREVPTRPARPGLDPGAGSTATREEEREEPLNTGGLVR